MISCQDNMTPSPCAAYQRERDYQRDHRIAESLQQVLLRTQPQNTLPNLSTEAFYEAALDEATVGGDSFDAFLLVGSRVALAVVDASGKGLAAAERVAEIRFALRAFLREHGDPVRALSCLNDFVCASQHLSARDEDTFATLTLVVLNCATGEMDCLCAGGEPPLVLRGDGTVNVAPARGPALGLFPGQGYASAPLHLELGDAVLLATDGLTEARRPAKGVDQAGTFLGLDGLVHLAVQAHTRQAQDPSASLHHLGRSIFEEARGFAGGAFHDDVCLLVGRRQMYECVKEKSNAQVRK